mmetsp:Transcript_8083/g.16758  ORF Transcript_8083/g.16758 Transcript_8083/m.16758 type:complete len:189 (-) Transcript_8083:193-759(-)|eukprot:CAMPEP_0201120874 /NCGR_PEP_ID=MMETSP0850-20130426/4862_1 /ASSEMBLY_ACC=CAM_ASM_000622 /TAXON_ID=183588 /ORGANISM="Pseudo-nitzschia fraudulenta, Strain WWA7" /LENGTH=188 /DNA_ID=CAMNT_0047387153 /DNA_START=97 /DNA_END=663 /DNA_ORIENTATION=-
MKVSSQLAVLAILASSGVIAFSASPINKGRTTGVSLSAERRDVLSTAFASAAGMASLFVSQAAMAEPRPMYLSEPTDEFKANEAKAMEFKRAQLARKKEFNAAIEKFLGEANDEGAIVKDLNDMQDLVAKTGGLPLGIKKDELFKIIRSKKGKGYWPTNCEIAYQSLQGEIRFQQSPNLDKENGNPFQ